MVTLRSILPVKILDIFQMFSQWIAERNCSIAFSEGYVMVTFIEIAGRALLEQGIGQTLHWTRGSMLLLHFYMFADMYLSKQLDIASRKQSPFGLY